jgi:hypothetical protein
MSFIQTNTYFTLTNICLTYKHMNCHSLPPKKNLVPRFGRKTLKGREVNHPSKVKKKQSHQRRLMLMVKAVGI